MSGWLRKTSGYETTRMSLRSGYLFLRGVMSAVAATFLPRPPSMCHTRYLSDMLLLSSRTASFFSLTSSTLVLYPTFI